MGRVHAAIAREIVRADRPFARPVVLLSGGETTVTLSGAGGRGGRNSEFLLSFALDIAGVPGISALAADTDGIDGSEDNAGAFADGGTAALIRAAGRDPAADLARHDAWGAFEAAGAPLRPGADRHQRERLPRDPCSVIFGGSRAARDLRLGPDGPTIG